MAAKMIEVRTQNKYDTAANWFESNRVLLSGEMGIESDTGLFKFGDGELGWNALEYRGTGAPPPDVVKLGDLHEWIDDWDE